MNSGDKLKAVFFIWGAFALACLFTFASQSSIEAGHVFLGLFFVIAALAATHTVMEAALPNETPTKTKTRRIDRVLSSLSDEELEQLRQRLSNDDGELMSLDEVMRERKSN
jgi:hypothetical protein